VLTCHHRKGSANLGHSYFLIKGKCVTFHEVTSVLQRGSKDFHDYSSSHCKVLKGFYYLRDLLINKVTTLMVPGYEVQDVNCSALQPLESTTTGVMLVSSHTPVAEALHSPVFLTGQSRIQGGNNFSYCALRRPEKWQPTHTADSTSVRHHVNHKL